MDPDRYDDERAIERLIASYGHLLDAQRWSALDEIFVPEGVFDATEAGYFAMHGIPAIRDHWAGPNVQHPFGHHATNVLISFVSADEADVSSKGLSVFADESGRGPVSSVLYEDRVRRTGAGWRIVVRKAIRRRLGA